MKPQKQNKTQKPSMGQDMEGWVVEPMEVPEQWPVQIERGISLQMSHPMNHFSCILCNKPL